jgi:RimJ/RimL family protein N-acetyltransferase
VPETERLVLRPWRDADAGAFASLCADPRVMRWVGRGGPLVRRDADASLAAIRDHWTRRGFGLWAAEEKAAPREFAGCVGLNTLPHGPRDVEIAWRLRGEAWGRGLATEGARFAATHAFAELGLPRIVALVHPGNAASLRVIEKLGMTEERRTTSRHGTPVVVYALEAYN